MKKIAQIVFVFFLIALLYQLVVTFFIKKYHYSYKYTASREEYLIDELYQKIGKEDIYNIIITDKNKKKYLFDLNLNLKKQKGILEDLIVYEKDNMKCLFPVFKANNYLNFVCSDKDRVYSYDYLKQNNNKNALDFVKILEKKGYTINAWKENDTFKEMVGNNTKILYNTNFIENYNVIVWKYNGVYSINKNKQSINDFLLGDVYDTKFLETSNDKLYVMHTLDGGSYFDKIYMVNLNDGKTKFLDVLDSNISSNSYFNGIYKKKVYFMDCNSSNQYSIDEKKEKVEITSKGNSIKYFDGTKLIDKKIDNIMNSNILFNKNVVSKKITEKYKTTDIKKGYNTYYFKTNDGNLYMANENDLDHVVLLFNDSNLKNWVVVNDTIFGVSKDSLYAYDFRYGLRPIIKYNEFNYHSDNMFGVIKI